MLLFALEPWGIVTIVVAVVVLVLLLKESAILVNVSPLI